MDTKSTPKLVRNPLELGRLIRERRRQAGYNSQETGARACSVGKRFLSECERGKATAEIGKIFDVLHGLGLQLAVVPRSVERTPSSPRSTRPLSQQLGLDYPYDWSNPAMSEDVFIQHVLEKGRFMDVLRLARHYGIDRIEAAAQAFEDGPQWGRLSQILDRIRIGKTRAAS